MPAALRYFSKGHWDEWEQEGVFCIPLSNVEVQEIIQEECK